MTLLGPYQRARLRMIGGVVAGYLLVWLVGHWMAVPAHVVGGASVLIQPSPVRAALAVVIACAVAGAAGTLLAGTIRFNAGLMAAAVGLAALSIRGGDSRHTWLYALSALGSGRNLYLTLAVEAVLLAVLLGGLWLVLRSLHVSGTLRDRETELMLDTPAHALANEAAAFALQLTVTGAGLLLLCQSEAKAQVMASLLVSSMIASAVAHSVFSTGPRSWYWLPPMTLAALAYALASASPPQGLEIADPRHTFVALLRPLPLDYASAGTAGAILGHWLSRRWERERLASAHPAPPSIAPSAAPSAAPTPEPQDPTPPPPPP